MLYNDISFRSLLAIHFTFQLPLLCQRYKKITGTVFTKNAIEEIDKVIDSNIF